MTKHTQGPWFVDKQGAPTIRQADGTVISGVPNNYADAHLIAAAPDLLDALKALVDTYGSVKGPLIQAALAAIAKAGGS